MLYVLSSLEKDDVLQNKFLVRLWAVHTWNKPLAWAWHIPTPHFHWAGRLCNVSRKDRWMLDQNASGSPWWETPRGSRETAPALGRKPDGWKERRSRKSINYVGHGLRTWKNSKNWNLWLFCLFLILALNRTVSIWKRILLSCICGETIINQP